MDYRLVPYIKKYLHEGHSLQQIRQSLISQGIPDSDIKQAAIYAMDEGTKEIKKNTSVIWVIPLILLIICGAAYYFQDNIKTFATDTIGKLNQQQTLQQKEKQPEQQETQQNIQETNIQETCDMDCLIASADNCNTASTDFESKIDFFGMIISLKNQYNIRQGDKCTLHIKVLDSNIEFSQKLIDQSLANGITEKELSIQLEESRINQKANIGKEAICIFQNNTKLKEFLKKTKDGTFTGSASCTIKDNCTITENSNNCEFECTYDGDWLLGECTGTMFSG